MPVRRSGLIVRDEGVILPPVNDLDFQGAGVTVALSGSKLIATIPGGGGGSVDWAGMGIFRPQDYGTIDPTGATESTTAFQAALTALNLSSYGGILDIPDGTYIVSNLVSASPGMNSRKSRIIRGAGAGATTLKSKTGTTNPILTVQGDTTTALPRTEIRDLNFNSNSQALTSVLRLEQLCWSKISNVQLDAWSAVVGIDGYGLITSTIEHCLIQAQTGIRGRTGSGFAANLCVLRDIVWSQCTTWALDWAGTGLQLEGRHDFEVNGTASNASTGCIKFAGGPFSAGPMLWFENNASGSAAIDVDSTDGEISGIVYSGDTLTLRNRNKLIVRRAPTFLVWTVDNTGGNLYTERADSVYSAASGGTKTNWHS